MKPDPGPKMYIAFGSTSHPKKGTTVLHMGVMPMGVMVNFKWVYAVIPKDNTKICEVRHVFEKAGCVLREGNDLPGGPEPYGTYSNHATQIRFSIFWQRKQLSVAKRCNQGMIQFTTNAGI